MFIRTNTAVEKRLSIIFMLVQLHHQLVEPQLQVVCFLFLEVPGGNLFADDLSSDVVIVVQTQSHLFQDEIHFLSSLHRIVSLYL